MRLPTSLPASLPLNTHAGIAVPEDLVLVGYISGAYGVAGWVRIKPYSTDAGALLHARTWWLNKPVWHDVDRLQAKMHGGDVVGQLMGVAGRDAAEALKGAEVYVSRRLFPALSDNEFYWLDLIGLRVENLQGHYLGQVGDLMDCGAHPILRVVSVGMDEITPEEKLIPFVDQFVKTVDQTAKKITVDWDLDY